MAKKNAELSKNGTPKSGLPGWLANYTGPAGKSSQASTMGPESLGQTYWQKAGYATQGEYWQANPEKAPRGFLQNNTPVSRPIINGQVGGGMDNSGRGIGDGIPMREPRPKQGAGFPAIPNRKIPDTAEAILKELQGLPKQVMVDKSTNWSAGKEYNSQIGNRKQELLKKGKELGMDFTMRGEKGWSMKPIPDFKPESNIPTSTGTNDTRFKDGQPKLGPGGLPPEFRNNDTRFKDGQPILGPGTDSESARRFYAERAAQAAKDAEPKLGPGGLPPEFKNQKPTGGQGYDGIKPGGRPPIQNTGPENIPGRPQPPYMGGDPKPMPPYMSGRPQQPYGDYGFSTPTPEFDLDDPKKLKQQQLKLKQDIREAKADGNADQLKRLTDKQSKLDYTIQGLNAGLNKNEASQYADRELRIQEKQTGKISAEAAQKPGGRQVQIPGEAPIADGKPGGRQVQIPGGNPLDGLKPDSPEYNAMKQRMAGLPQGKASIDDNVGRIVDVPRQQDKPKKPNYLDGLETDSPEYNAVKRRMAGLPPEQKTHGDPIREDRGPISDAVQRPSTGIRTADFQDKNRNGTDDRDERGSGSSGARPTPRDGTVGPSGGGGGGGGGGKPKSRFDQLNEENIAQEQAKAAAEQRARARGEVPNRGSGRDSAAGGGGGRGGGGSGGRETAKERNARMEAEADKKRDALDRKIAAGYDPATNKWTTPKSPSRLPANTKSSFPDKNNPQPGTGRPFTGGNSDVRIHSTWKGYGDDWTAEANKRRKAGDLSGAAEAEKAAQQYYNRKEGENPYVNIAKLSDKDKPSSPASSGEAGADGSLNLSQPKNNIPSTTYTPGSPNTTGRPLSSNNTGFNNGGGMQGGQGGGSSSGSGSGSGTVFIPYAAARKKDQLA